MCRGDRPVAPTGAKVCAPSQWERQLSPATLRMVGAQRRCTPADAPLYAPPAIGEFSSPF